MENILKDITEISEKTLDPNLIQKYFNIFETWVISFFPKFIGAIIFLYLGFKIANFFSKLLEKFFARKDFDPTVEKFLVNLLKYLLKAMVVLASIGILGVQTSSFVALIAAAGFAIGSALSGSLSHFASGIVILLFRPYKLGDIVEIGGVTGTVVDVTIFATKLKTVDGKAIIIPNAKAISDRVINFNDYDERRLDMRIGISYNDDIDHARKILEKIAKNHNGIIINDENPVKILVHSLGDNSVNLAFRATVKASDFASIQFELFEIIKKEFDKNNLHFPFPQRDVHLYTQK